MWRKGNPCTLLVGMSIGCSHCGKEYVGSSKNKEIELPYDPAIPVLGIYLKKTKTLAEKDKRIPIFTAALFIITKTWKQAKHPIMDE